MKLFKAPVLFAFFAVLVSFTAMASLGEGSTNQCLISACKALHQGLTTNEHSQNERSVEAAEKSANAAIRSAVAAESDTNTDKRILWASIAAAIAAAFAALFTWITLCENKKYNRIQTRAYITIEKIMIREITDDKEKNEISLRIYIKNSGNTPATDIKYEINEKIVPTSDHNEPKKLEISQESTNIGVLSNNDNRWIKQSYIEKTNGEIYNFIISDKKLLVYGTIMYTDIYGYKHITYFSRYSTKEIISDTENRSLASSPFGNSFLDI